MLLIHFSRFHFIKITFVALTATKLFDQINIIPLRIKAFLLSVLSSFINQLLLAEGAEHEAWEPYNK